MYCLVDEARQVSIAVFGVLLGALLIIVWFKLNWLRWDDVLFAIINRRVTEQFFEDLAISLLASSIFAFGSLLFFIYWWSTLGGIIESMHILLRAFFALLIAVSPWPFCLLAAFSIMTYTGHPAALSRIHYLVIFAAYIVLTAVLSEIAYLRVRRQELAK